MKKIIIFLSLFIFSCKTEVRLFNYHDTVYNFHNKHYYSILDIEHVKGNLKYKSIDLKTNDTVRYLPQNSIRKLK